MPQTREFMSTPATLDEILTVEEAAAFLKVAFMESYLPE
jgi:hypothetical protein